MNDGLDFISPRSEDERVLRIYVAEHCGACRESRRLARIIAGRLNDIVVEVVDIDHQEPVDEIFAVPTFCYRGKILSLGNPGEDELIARVLTLERESERLAPQERSRQGADLPRQGAAAPAVATAVASRGQMPAGRNRLITAWCGALGIGGALLCSLTMVAPALGLIAVQGMRPPMGGVSSSASTTQAQLPAWSEAIVRLGPEILAVSVLLVALAAAFRRRLAALPAAAGGLILYLGLYAQPSLVVMDAATVLGIALLVLAYVAGLRPALGLAPVRPHS
jgi:hypothetical protein